jgi:transporter family-2 protein
MRLARAQSIGLALGGGLVVATQSRINGQLSEVVGLASAAALLSATTGLVIASVGVAVLPGGRAALRRIPGAVRRGSLPWWALPAGMLGGLLLFSQAFAVPSLGVAVYSVVIVASLTVAGLAVDRGALAPTGPHPVTPSRVGGAGLAVGAAVLAAGPDLATGALVPGAVLVAMTAGAAAALQSAMLGHVGVGAGHPVAATWVNFLGATLALAILVAATAGGASWRPPAPGWLWLGGPLGLLIVATIVVTVPRAGVLMVTLAMTAGQLVGSVLWDWWAPVAGRSVDAWSVTGAILLLGAVTLASGALRRPGRPAQA